ncbi:cytidine deaminase-like protein, partial [Laetiporus sulphureus 93-53]
PQHLNGAGCRIGCSEGTGRGVVASRPIDAYTVVEISPVLLFSSEEYEAHGKYTVLDPYTFRWRDGQMALALGLGSLFNHSQSPNVSYIINTKTESIRYTTMRRIETGEELCIFYGHKLWFDVMDDGAGSGDVEEEEVDDGWGGLARLNANERRSEIEDDSWAKSDAQSIDGRKETFESLFKRGGPDEVVPEEQLPLTRVKLTDDEEEEELSAVHTECAWVVDIPDARHITTMLKWLKASGLDTPSLPHLKRIREVDAICTLILTYTSLSPSCPALPADLPLPAPYILPVPSSAAITSTSLSLKNTFWPTMFTSRRKLAPEAWTRRRALWACERMLKVVKEAQKAGSRGELPVAAYVPAPYDEETREASRMRREFVEYDRRRSACHPSRHAVMNVIRAVADYRTSSSSSSSEAPSLSLETEPTPSPSMDLLSADSSSTTLPSPQTRNGSHYLLTSLTLFTSHEPCVMCSMALLHSRVREVFYARRMPQTGGCGGIACVPALEGVNHRFGVNVWKGVVIKGKQAGEGLDA